MSKTYLERKNPDGPFIFISYSHKDADAVGRALTALNDCGADFWYDVKLRGGQDWIKKVREVTANKNCVGILYFISANSIYSDACFEEFNLLGELQNTHDKFDAFYILLDEEEPSGLNAFFAKSTQTLFTTYPDAFEKIIQRSGYIHKEFDKNKIYFTAARKNTDGDALISRIFKDVFIASSCASEETGKIDILQEDELVDRNYRVRTRSRISVDLVRGEDVEWKVYSYNGNTISAVLVMDELYAATCMSMAKSAMQEINEKVNVSLKADVTDDKKRERHIKFDEQFTKCLIPDADGNLLRYLRSNEHEMYYLQLKEVLEKVPVSDSIDDGYMFVQDNQGNILFADRVSKDVYRHIHVNAYASVLPVIDIDYTKYKEYVLHNQSAKAE